MKMPAASASTPVITPEMARAEIVEILIWAYVHDMESHDENKEALKQVEKATESEPAKSKDLLESEDLERKVVDSKKRITDENTSRPTS
jgi:hypothetical protein